MLAHEIAMFSGRSGRQTVSSEKIAATLVNEFRKTIDAKYGQTNQFVKDLENSLRVYLKDGGSYDYMNATMQALLLCAIYELNYTVEVDKKVIIQEYVDLAYAFFTKNEPKMINALLDQISKNVRI